MIECGSVVILEMCEEGEVSECKDANLYKLQMRLRESLWSSRES